MENQIEKSPVVLKNELEQMDSDIGKRVNLIAFGISDVQSEAALQHLKERDITVESFLKVKYSYDPSENYSQKMKRRVEANSMGTGYFSEDTWIYVKDNEEVNPSFPILIVAKQYMPSGHFAALFDVLGNYMGYERNEKSQIYGLVEVYSDWGLKSSPFYRHAILSFTFDRSRHGLIILNTVPLVVGKKIS